MNHEEVGRYWDENAEVWTELARAGYDHSRDGLNTPAFFEMLPDVDGLSGLDVGCGEGHNTRLLAGRGARMTGIDIELMAEQAGRGRVRAGTLRRTVPERRVRSRASWPARRAGRGLLSARQGEKTGGYRGLTEARAFERG